MQNKKFKIPKWVYNWKVLLAGIAVFFLVVMPIASIVSSQFSKSFNYSFHYEKRVQNTVCDMIKPEALTPKYQKLCK